MLLILLLHLFKKVSLCIAETAALKAILGVGVVDVLMLHLEAGEISKHLNALQSLTESG